MRERHGVFLDTDAPLEEDPVAPYGKDFADPANLPFWWSLGGLGLWQMARIGLSEATEHKLWDTELFAQIKLIAAINDNDPEQIRVWLHTIDAIVNFGFLREANTYACRQRNVRLASVLDHRFGEMRDQVHIWQAAIDPDAMVFTTHPLTAPKATGLERRRRARVLDRRGLDAAHRPAPAHRHPHLPARMERDHRRLAVVGVPVPAFTHAFVPQDRFDEVVQVGNWTFVTKCSVRSLMLSFRTTRRTLVLK